MLHPFRLVLAAWIAVAGGTTESPPVQPGELASLRFMAGCWRGPAGPKRVIEEHYTAPSANLILGMTRYLEGDSATGYEFTTITRQDGSIVLTPRPEGQTPASFRLVALDRGSASWENPEHDFPTRITYRRIRGDTLVARVEGPGSGGSRVAEWRMVPARCGG